MQMPHEGQGTKAKGPGGIRRTSQTELACLAVPSGTAPQRPIARFLVGLAGLEPATQGL